MLRYLTAREAWIKTGLVAAGVLAGILVMMIANSAPPGPQVSPADTAETGQDTTVVEFPQPGDSTSTFQDVVDSVVQSVVAIRHYKASGSGVVIASQGYIITNHHVVEGAGKLHVLFSNKQEYEAYTVGVDPATDLAVIQIILRKEESVPAMKIGDSEMLQLADRVWAVGNPLSLKFTVTEGIVSAKGRSFKNFLGVDPNVRFIQTDAPINPGNSGGALVNLHGELIGINTLGTTRSGFYEGYGFAIPGNLAMRVASDLMEYGEVRRGYMGIGRSMDVDAAMARSLGMATIQGVYVDQVDDGGAADLAGVRSGDVILAVDGSPVDQSDKLYSAILMKRPGSGIEVTYLRNGRTGSLYLTLFGHDHPSVTTQPPAKDESGTLIARYLDRWGLVLRDKSDKEKTHYKEWEGVIIERVIRQDQVQYLREGLLVERINGHAVSSVQEAIKVLQNTDGDARLSVRNPWDIHRLIRLPELK